MFHTLESANPLFRKPFPI